MTDKAQPLTEQLATIAHDRWARAARLMIEAIGDELEARFDITPQDFASLNSVARYHELIAKPFADLPGGHKVILCEGALEALTIIATHDLCMDCLGKGHGTCPDCDGCGVVDCDEPGCERDDGSHDDGCYGVKCCGYCDGQKVSPCGACNNTGIRPTA